jgi:hypothetical protein
MSVKERQYPYFETSRAQDEVSEVNLFHGIGNRTIARMLLIVALALTLASFLYFWRTKNERAFLQYAQMRQFVIQSILDRFSSPIIVLGDSIVELSTLPPFLCNHAVINAGISGAQTTSGLAAILKQSLRGKRAKLIVLSIGTNDAVMSRRTDDFARSYKSLLEDIKPLTEHAAVMAIPELESPIEANERINEYNAAISMLATQQGIDFVHLPQMPTPHTTDGIHLDNHGYSIWDAALLRQTKLICSSE